MSEFFKGYRLTALAPDAIIASIRIPVTQKGEYLRAYKQSKRKDDDIAIVNAALRVAIDDSQVVTSTSLVYGGMAPTTISARKAGAYLLGKNVPGGMATYRKSLAFGFFYRFYHEILSQLEVKDLEVDAQAIPEIERMISFGKEDREATVAYQQNVLGKASPHVAALKQTCGEAQYTDDIPVQKNELYGCLVLSTKAHAKITSVNYAPALDLPGVVQYVDHTDMPSPEANCWGAPVCDETFFAVDEVFTTGQPIGIVLADSAAHASAGARAVKVEYEDLPAIFTMEEAIEKESFFDHYRYIKKGEPEKAFEKADHVFSGVSRIGWRKWKFWSGTQNPTETQTYVAQVCDVAANKVVSKVKRLGGGFGGKETRSIQLCGIVSLAAKKTGRPVRCMLNRDEDMITSGQRHPFLSRWKVAINKDGKIQALDLDMFCNGGWTQDLSGAVLDRSLSHSDNCYMIPNIHVRGRVCKTNTMSNTAFRGFGGPQGLFMAESYIEEVADRLGMPAEKLREINFYKANEQTHFNQALKDWHVPIMYKQVQEESNYATRREAITKFNAEHKWKKRGLSIIPTKFGISFTALFLNQAGALVSYLPRWICSCGPWWY
ncbi:hypothetical protein EYC84_011075 [Monilinia fructicola]|nr:hypothetical protein EYC84_011075 [Monilinia fructicola]